MSDTLRLSELATPDFLISVVRLVEAMIAFETHFLQAFFPFRLAKLGTSRP